MKPGHLDPRRCGTLTWDTPEHLKPRQDHVLLQLEPPKETPDGIIIPVSNQEEALVPALIVAAGPGINVWSKKQKRDVFKPTMLRAGQRVLVNKDPGWILGEYRMLREGAVVAVLEDEEAAE